MTLADAFFKLFLPVSRIFFQFFSKLCAKSFPTGAAKGATSKKTAGISFV